MKEARWKRLHIAWFHLYEIFRNGKSVQTENRSAVVWGWEQEQAMTTNEHEGISGDNGIALILDGDSWTTLYTKNYWIIQL